MKKLTQEQFIERAIDTHDNKYSYELVEYINTTSKVKITCPVHGTFEQSPKYHMKGFGCKGCSGKQQLTKQNVIDRFCDIHGDKYSYELVEYTGRYNKIKIVCSTHGVFEQTPKHHMRGQGCPICANVLGGERSRLTITQFIDRSSKIHNNFYTYDNSVYIDTHTKIEINCPVHGTFEQVPYDHMSGHGCPMCVSIISKDKIELQEWVSQFIDTKTNDRSLISPYEVDILIPSKNIAIEYNGLYWHSEQQGKDKNYHLNKYNLCKEKGYRLIQIWENEWLTKKDIIKSVILNSIGVCDTKIHGRKCDIRDTPSKDARVFYDDNHIQGFKGGDHSGLYYNDELVSLMTIDTNGELHRFVNKINTIVHGAFSKLLKSFRYDYIYTFADLRYFTGNVYSSNGFEYCHDVIPRYWYFNNSVLVHHRRSFQKKGIITKYNNGDIRVYDGNKTEYQNMIDNGYNRIWDCGKIKFVLVS